MINIRGVKTMRLSRSLGLAAAAVAGLGLSPGAFAAGTPSPDTTLLYSAQSIALAASGNTVVLPNTTFPGAGFPGYLGYVAPGAASIAVGASVTFTLPAADTFTIADPATAAGGTACIWFVGPGAVGATAATTPTGSGTNTITCTNAAPVAGAVATSAAVNLATFAAFSGNKVSIAGPDVAQLGANTFAGLAPLSGTTSAQSAVLQINGTGPGDAAGGIPILALNSKNSFSVTLVPVASLQIDLGGTGLPAIPPGAGFLQGLANGTRLVSTAGYLGALWVNVSQTDRDARTGFLGINNPTPSATPPSASAITGTVTTTLSGDFATITSAYLVPNTSVPNENAPACTATAPTNAIAGTIDAAKRSIAFATFPTSPNAPFSGSQPAFGVCLVTNGTQVIQESPTAGGLIATPAPNSIQIVVSAAVTGVANPYVLTPAPSSAFGSIQYQGSVFFAQNVFGANNLYPTFFRVVNSSNAPVKIWAVLTKDVNNVVPETGNGSCNDPGGITATCNTAFVANLTALTDPTGLSKGSIQANTAVYYTADQIAALAGTSLPASSLHATMYLMSPSSGVRFSAVSQNPVNLDLISVP
jgi:hypothetical protein